MRLDGPGWGPPRFEVMVEPKPTYWIVWDNELGIPASQQRFENYTQAEKHRKVVVKNTRAGTRRVVRRRAKSG
jgi:hypothetical protein